MYEMLGNQLFLARKYSQAAENLKLALDKNPENLTVKRKLVICYAKTGKVEKALELFLSILRVNIDFIVNTDPQADDCPCPELTSEMEKKLNENRESLDYQLILGILWLYCNVDKSITYFRKAQEMAPRISTLNAIVKILNNYKVQLIRNHN